jgi:sigma-B regulation protein RsbU (phosphoserine phosphatase)
MLMDVSYSPECDRILLPGDALLLTTDGIWEASNAAGDAFGRQRLRRLLLDTSGGGAQGSVDAILREVDHHGRGLPERDDMTLAVLKRLE